MKDYEMYVTTSDTGIVELRQTRYKHLIHEHPDDLCAVARSVDELRAMLNSLGIFENEILWPNKE